MSLLPKRVILFFLLLSIALNIINVHTLSIHPTHNPEIYASEDPVIPVLMLKNDKSVYHIGLQAGHWKNRELPPELNLIRESDGATGSGKMEWEVNLKIAQIVKTFLEQQQIAVDLLPSTIPPNYRADLFVSIHADAYLDPNISGAKVSSSIFDTTRRALFFVNTLEREYLKATHLQKDYHLTRNMTEYYAFNRSLYKHTIDEKTVGAIIETGFLSNKGDTNLLVNHPQQAAIGIVNGIISYLNEMQEY